MSEKFISFYKWWDIHVNSSCSEVSLKSKCLDTLRSFCGDRLADIVTEPCCSYLSCGQKSNAQLPSAFKFQQTQQWDHIL